MSRPTRYIEQIPIRTIDFDDADAVAQHDDMVAMVTEMLDLHAQRAGATGAVAQQIEQRITALDDDIDQLVYKLYALTPDEIRIVEAQT